MLLLPAVTSLKGLTQGSEVSTFSLSIMEGVTNHVIYTGKVNMQTK